MSTFQPMTPNWLSASFDKFTADDPELMSAYGWGDYPSDMTGEGNWVDLYLDETDEHVVGRLWINPESGDIGLIELQYSNTDYLTKSALELREFASNGVGPREAYDYIKNDYYCGEEQTGQLDQLIEKDKV